jgi:homeodomain-containing protein/integrase-like protein
MPWKESKAMNERARFCRQTGYKWLRRFRDAGHDIRALEDRSRRPHHSPTAVPEMVQDVIVDVRKAHPRWGPRKLRAWLVERHPGTQLPSASAMATILQRRGMTTPRRRRVRRRPTSTPPFAAATAPNSVWAIDFKGKFKTGDGVWCTPFTVTDAFSRYCIRCEIVEEANRLAVERILDSAFREFGLPTAIRSDNGPPFAAPGLAGLTRRTAGTSAFTARSPTRPHHRRAPMPARSSAPSTCSVASTTRSVRTRRSDRSHRRGSTCRRRAATRAARVSTLSPRRSHTSSASSACCRRRARARPISWTCRFLLSSRAPTHVAVTPPSIAKGDRAR